MMRTQGLVGLISGLSVTSDFLLFFSVLRPFLARLSGLSVLTSDKRAKKSFKINACQLVRLVTPTGEDTADKRPLSLPCLPPVRARGMMTSAHRERDGGQTVRPRITSPEAAP